MDHDFDRKHMFKDHDATVGECDNVTVTPPILPPGTNPVILVPVVLQELSVRTNLVTTIHFPDPVLEIKDIKKRVKIVQCRLLVPPAGTVLAARPVPLFLKGFIRKNIQYATPCHDGDKHAVSSEIRSLTIDVPFQCVTNITTFLTPPSPPALNTSSEFDFFRAQDLGPGFPEKDQLLSSDLSQFHQFSQQFFNPLPRCELLASRILEWDEAINREPLEGAPFEEGTFDKVVEKVFLEFDIKILQDRQVRVANIGF